VAIAVRRSWQNPARDATQPGVIFFRKYFRKQSLFRKLALDSGLLPNMYTGFTRRTPGLET